MEHDLIDCVACGIDHQALTMEPIPDTKYLVGECPETGEVVVYDMETEESFLLEDE